MCKLLIVDDDASIREVLALILGEEGFQVTLARNGQEALAYLTKESGWIVLLDLMMPVLSGWEVLERLQADPRLRDHHHVAVMSAQGRLDELAACHASSLVEALLPKPFEMPTLLATVFRLGSCTHLMPATAPYGASPP